MDKKLENTLYNIDPIFFEEAIACVEGNMNEMNTCMYWGCECGDGWFESIATLARKTKILNELGKQYNVKFVCGQLKEKWGYLTIYACSRQIIESEESCDEAETLKKMFRDAIHEAENEAEKTCEFCGHKEANFMEDNPIVYTNGWIHGICEKCARELSDEKNKKSNPNKITDLSKGSGYGFLSLFSQRDRFSYNEKTYDNILNAYIDNCGIKNIGLDEQWFKELKGISNKDNIHYLYVFIRKYIFEKTNTTWNYDLLKDIIKSKFSVKLKSKIGQKLLETNDKEIIWFNLLDDNELGKCFCQTCRDNKVEGKNLFGKILMEVRNELKEELKYEII